MKTVIDKKALLKKNSKAKKVFEKNAAIMKDIPVEKTKYRLGNPYGAKIMHPVEEQSDWEDQRTPINYVRLRRY